MKTIITLLLLFIFQISFSQDIRIQQIKNNIEAINTESLGLNEKVNINIKEASLSSFLLAVSEVHKVNISVAPSLAQISIVNNFTDVTVADLLVFLCKEYNLTIDFTGNILSIKPYEKPIEKAIIKTIDVQYDGANDLVSFDLKEDKLYDAFKKIMNESGKNLVFAPGLENQLLTAYIKNMPFDAALNKLAYANNLSLTKSRDNFYLFDTLEGNYSLENSSEKNNTTVRQNKPQRSRKSNFFFNVIDAENKLLEVDFENTPIASIVYDIGHELGIDMFISSPLESAGNATFKAKNISFDNLLVKLFESKMDSKTVANNSSQPQQFSNDTSSNSAGDSYTFMKNGSIYYFGTKNQLVVRNVKVIPLMHRSIELLGNPTSEGRSSGRLNNSNTNNYTNNSSDNKSNSNTNNYQSQGNDSSSGKDNASSQSILSIVPAEITKDLDIKVDKELNSFVVNGPAANIDRFESFIKYIDKAVPVILIEVMLLEVSKSATIETGFSAGIGDKPVTTKGTVFPNSDIVLGAQTINKIINSFDGFGSLNIGSVVPNFNLSLKAMESNGNLKIRSAPRLSTLNGHKAYLSIGETTYYVVTNQNFYGSQIPQTSEVKNYQPIDAELSVTIMPLVSGDGQITMDIKVIQSSFNGQKVDKNAPPGINSREFTSIIRVKDQDLIVLGGLEEKVKNDSGSGVPILARIPIIKWLFSSRKREDSNKKLTVLIKPTVIY
ncbi:general secretion pathway protein GspD [Flavobacterium psychrophilum]|uniref:Bacterial general secretion pathway protein D n=2 Tax=Flavobacterium psychrophilum TaxID=96345 RepID=A6H1Y0_FLAPJ|nr:general secretion pathway protein GspD [Flavobacterium psychrophilum]AIG31025.1 general secretion pathway protein GspD [Flavobacterium psychrophilum]AIG33302.1 general secretion pathway protein GspD [Flavobacterium psychrophilum]AIG35451.1 general secretion pathway protein GspD [Flavobacterium psychrophilum]AIG37812.1 general secretion pathway protein GspD [Flavobacterium psychrophilum]AIG40083.1 general secretion pathway protein GspD [Flavobacterium psychrophilum]